MKSQTKDNRPETLKRLKALGERLHGSGPDFMTQEDLRIMHEDRIWNATGASLVKAP